MKSSCLLVAGVLLAAVGAEAYRPAYSDNGIRLRWPTACVVYHVNERGSTDVITEKAILATIEGFESWTQVEGSYIRPLYGGLTNVETVGMGDFPRNVVLWREGTDEWDMAPTSVISVTTVTYDATSAVIMDSDIELNGAYFEFTTDDEVVAHDIRATITHEAGHLLGLDHSEVPYSVMNPYFEEGSLHKRELSQDDVAGILYAYPSGDDPGSCSDGTVGDWFPTRSALKAGVLSTPPSCATGSSRGTAGWLAFGLLVLLVGLRRWRTGAAAALALFALVLPSSAGAYVLYTTCPDSTGAECQLDPSKLVPLRWYSNEAALYIDSHPPAQMDAAEAQQLIPKSYRAWSELSCEGQSTPFTWNYEGVVSGSRVGYEEGAANRNVVIWVTDKGKWTHGGAVLALTSLTYDTGTGEIVDADLELNNATFVYSATPEDDEVDLENTVVHEAGHCLGLDHSKDKHATMYEKAPLGEVKKRDLTDDDREGYCALYGPNAPPYVTRSQKGNGSGGGDSCSAGARGGAGPAGLLLALALGLLGLVRRRSVRL